MKRGVFVVAVVIATTLFNLSVLAKMVPDYLGIDFAVFVRVLTEHPVELYRDTGPMPFLYPPTAILPFMAVATIGFAAFTLLSGIAFFWSVKTVCDKKIAGLALLSQAAVKGLQLGQIPMILAAGMFAGLRMPRLLGGMLWGVVASIKPQLMMFAPLALIVRRDWEMLTGMAIGAALSFGVAIVAFGPSVWLDWHYAVTFFAEGPLADGGAIKAVTPGGVAIQAGYPSLPFVLLGGFIGAVAILLSAQRLRDQELIALIVAASLAVSPYAHAHDTIAIIPACVVFMLRGRWAYAIPGAMMFFGTPILVASSLLGILLLFAFEGSNLKMPRLRAV